MKSLKLVIALCVMFIFVFPAFSQRKVGGKVVEVLDGKTAVILMPNGSNLTVELQFIEVPENGQPLNQTVKEHLQKLILDRIVEVDPLGIKDDRTIGKLTLNGVDISQQMIRDGAAWYAILETGGQSQSESTNYFDQEARAKAEKRGVWSDGKMVPAWEFRAAKLEAAKQAERDILEKTNREAIDAQAAVKAAEPPKRDRAKEREITNSGEIIWANPAINLTEIPDVNGLITAKVAGMNSDMVMTGPAFYYLSNGKEKLLVESRTMFLGKIAGANELVGIGFLTKSANGNFKNSDSLTIVADDEKFLLGKAFRQEKKTGKLLEEMLIYYFDMNVFNSIAAAQKVKFILGDYSAEMTGSAHDAHKNLYLQMAKK